MSLPVLAMFSLFITLVTVRITTTDNIDDVDVRNELLQLRAELEKMQMTLDASRIDSRRSVNDVATSNDKSTMKDQLFMKSDPDSVNELQRDTKSCSDHKSGGVSYIRWGRSMCDGEAVTVYRGHAAGPHYAQGGAGANMLCLHDKPQYKKYIPGFSTYGGLIHGVQYELFNDNNVFAFSSNNGQSLLSQPAPCSACYVPHRSAVLVVPARTQCPDGWNKEYAGYIVSDATHDARRHRSQYVCWDEAPERATDGEPGRTQAVIYPVQLGCGTLPCSKFMHGWEMTCVVCTK